MVLKSRLNKLTAWWHLSKLMSDCFGKVSTCKLYRLKKVDKCLKISQHHYLCCVLWSKVKDYHYNYLISLIGGQWVSNFVTFIHICAGPHSSIQYSWLKILTLNHVQITNNKHYKFIIIWILLKLQLHNAPRSQISSKFALLTQDLIPFLNLNFEPQNSLFKSLCFSCPLGRASFKMV